MHVLLTVVDCLSNKQGTTTKQQTTISHICLTSLLSTEYTTIDQDPKRSTFSDCWNTIFYQPCALLATQSTCQSIGTNTI